jgi:hypothetical protein
MHHAGVSTNYAWLPHNVDPSRHKTPSAYRNMAIQPLGDRQAEFDEYLQGCIGYYNDLNEDKPKGFLCQRNEQDRVAMSLRQPAGMYNYT